MSSEPVLTRIPRGQLLDADRIQPDSPQATVLFTDGHWRPATIVAWCRYRRGLAVLLRWQSGHEDWRVHDPQCLLLASLGDFD